MWTPLLQRYPSISFFVVPLQLIPLDCISAEMSDPLTLTGAQTPAINEVPKQQFLTKTALSTKCIKVTAGLILLLDIF